MITERQRILVELIRTAAANPGIPDEQIREMVAEKMGLPVELVNEATDCQEESCAS